MVRKGGFEPPRSCERQPLKLRRKTVDQGRPRKTGVGFPFVRPCASDRGRVFGNPLHRVCTMNEVVPRIGSAGSESAGSGNVPRLPRQLRPYVRSLTAGQRLPSHVGTQPLLIMKCAARLTRSHAWPNLADVDDVRLPLCGKRKRSQRTRATKKTRSARAHTRNRSFTFST